MRKLFAGVRNVEVGPAISTDPNPNPNKLWNFRSHALSLTGVKMSWNFHSQCHWSRLCHSAIQSRTGARHMFDLRVRQPIAIIDTARLLLHYCVSWLCLPRSQLTVTQHYSQKIPSSYRTLGAVAVDGEGRQIRLSDGRTASGQACLSHRRWLCNNSGMDNYFCWQVWLTHWMTLEPLAISYFKADSTGTWQNSEIRNGPNCHLKTSTLTASNS